MTIAAVYSQSTDLPLPRLRVRGTELAPDRWVVNNLRFRRLVVDGPLPAWLTTTLDYRSRAYRALPDSRPQNCETGHQTWTWDHQRVPSPRTMTIICSMIDRLARGPDQDVHVPSRAAQKYPSRCRCHILVIDYRWGSMGSDDRYDYWGPAIDVFYGSGAIGSKLFTLFGCRSARGPLRDWSGVG